MCVTAIANLQQTSVKDGTNRQLFSKEKELIPYIEYHWEALTTTSRRVTQSWHATVHRALIKDIHVLFVFEDHPTDGQMYGLINTDLTHIKPNYDAMIKGGMLRVTDMGVQHGELASSTICHFENNHQQQFTALETICFFGNFSLLWKQFVAFKTIYNLETQFVIPKRNFPCCKTSPEFEKQFLVVKNNS